MEWRERAWLQAEPSNHFLSSTTSSSLGVTVCGNSALNIYHLPQSFRLAVWVYVCVGAHWWEEGWGVVGKGGGSLKNNISLYMSKSVRLERNQVSVRSWPPNRKGWESLQKSSVIIPFFLFLLSPSQSEDRLVVPSPQPRFQPDPLLLHLILVVGGQEQGLSTREGLWHLPKGGRGR